jgi:hypothetical protein
VAEGWVGRLPVDLRKSAVRVFSCMKFIQAMLAYLAIALVLVLGIMKAVSGSLWLLIAGLLAYVLAFAIFGCLAKDHS